MLCGVGVRSALRSFTVVLGLVAALACAPLGAGDAVAQSASSGNFFTDLGKLFSGQSQPAAASTKGVQVPGYGAKKRLPKDDILLPMVVRPRKVPTNRGVSPNARILTLPGPASDGFLGDVGGFGGSSDWADHDGTDAPRVRPGGGYRTMCVRMCDGYYWPISNAAYSSDLTADKRICESSCATPAKLFYQTDRGENPARMRSLDGKVYGKLKTAFAYRKSLSPSCKCKPDPWADSEILRHKMYARMPHVVVDDRSAAAAGPDRAVAASLDMFEDPGAALYIEFDGTALD